MKANMTVGNETKLIFFFTLPLMLGNFLQQLYNTVDGIVVGNFVSKAALGAVGTCAPLTMLFTALAIGLSTGCSIMVSQYLGAKKQEDVKSSVITSLILVFCLGLALSLIGVLTTDFLIERMLKVPASILADASAYFRIFCYGLVFQFLYNIIAAVLRAYGDSKATLYFLFFAAVTNIVLDLVFVLVFNWGVPGVAIATVIAQAGSAFISLIYIFKRHPELRFTKEELVFNREKGKLALRLGIPTTVQYCAVSFGHIAMQRLVNSFGEDMMSAITAGTRIEYYVLIPIFSYNAGLATFTGQNIGAGKMDRVMSGYKKGLKLSGITCVILITIVMLWAEPLARLFGVEGQVLGYAVSYLRFISPFVFVFAFYQNSIAVLQGAGDVLWPLLCSVESLAIRVALAYILVQTTSLSYRVIWYTVPIGWALGLIPGVVRLFRGKWKEKAIVKAETLPQQTEAIQEAI